MKNKFLKLACMLCVCLGVIIVCNVSKASNEYAEYTIDSYDIKMIVNENNTFDITEKITVNFTQYKHGINRKIPTRNTIKRLDGTTSNNRAKITNIEVSENYSTSTNNGYKILKIGSSNKTYIGKHTYTISYTYDIGKDPLKDADELYYNLIGTDSDTTISNVTFTIKMPKKFDYDGDKLGFSSGLKGSIDSSNVEYTVNKNTISGSYIGTLGIAEGLTVRLTLPEGYFVRVQEKDDNYVILVSIISVACVIVSALLWRLYGKDNKVVETVEFYPPEGLNSAELAYIYKGVAEDEGIISLLISLANKGYLRIEDFGKKNLIDDKDFRITKLKEYTGNNETEKEFFDGLFKKKNSVTNEDLYDSFYKTIRSIKSKLESKENKNKIFEKSSLSKIIWLALMCIVILLLITVKPIVNTSAGEDLPFLLAFPIIGFSVILLVGFRQTNLMIKIFGIVWGALFGGIPLVVEITPILVVEVPQYLTSYIIGLICIAIIIVFAKIMPKRTKYGSAMLGKIKGFKRFLEVAEKEELENLVSENPQYFYYILPYTYALGVSDKWVKQFESIAMQAPNWYTSPNGFSMDSFGRFMSSTMKSAQSSMTSAPSSSGGGSSGGGSSGGGSGGGGVSSW